MNELSKTEIADIAALDDLCSRVEAELVIIGALAYQLFFPDEERHTSDVDLAIALDLDDFQKVCDLLRDQSWTQDANREHRWRSSRRTIIDLIPAGEKLRRAKRVTWPRSGSTMSLVGFDHVFSEARSVALSNAFSVRVIPPTVLMLLKVVAVMDDPAQRLAKDLPDIRGLLSRYEANSDRLFGEKVFDAELGDFSLANALLLGVDLDALCAENEAVVVRSFISYIGDETRSAWAAFVRAASRRRTK